jgi:hypothetical protein
MYYACHIYLPYYRIYLKNEIVVHLVRRMRVCDTHPIILYHDILIIIDYSTLKLLFKIFELLLLTQEHLEYVRLSCLFAVVRLKERRHGR